MSIENNLIQDCIYEQKQFLVVDLASRQTQTSAEELNQLLLNTKNDHVVILLKITREQALLQIKKALSNPKLKLLCSNDFVFLKSEAWRMLGGFLQKDSTSEILKDFLYRAEEFRLFPFVNLCIAPDKAEYAAQGKTSNDTGITNIIEVEQPKKNIDLDKFHEQIEMIKKYRTEPKPIF